MEQCKIKVDGGFKIMSGFYNLILETFILPLGDFLNGSYVIIELRNWRKISKLSDKEINDLQKQNLSSLLDFASSQIPYYKNLGIAPDDDPYTRIKNFPVMSKKKIRENTELLLSTSKEKLIACKSSGSSGIQSTVYQNKKEQSLNRALQMLWWEWAGYYPGKKIVQTGINPKRGRLKTIKDFLFRTKYIAAFAHTESEVVALLKKLKGRKGYHFGGYASSLNVFAEIAKKNNINDVRFDAAISWGDKLFNHYRENISSSFGCITFDTYGCSEGLMVGAKKDLDYFYIMSPHIFIEIVDDFGNRVPDGEWGHILLTRLDNYSMPLIRYKIGDTGSLLPRNEYPEKREMLFPLLKQLIGRDTDIVKTKSGKYMVVHAFTGIFEHIPEIVQFKVIQKSYDSIEIEYIPSGNFVPEILTLVTDKIHSSLGEKLPVYWKRVKTISRSRSGKPVLVESLLNTVK